MSDGRFGDRPFRAGGRNELESLNDQIQHSLPHSRLASQYLGSNEIDSIRDQIARMQGVSEKALQIGIDMEGYVAKIELERTTATRQLSKSMEDVAQRLVDFGALVRELPSASELHATVAKAKVLGYEPERRAHELEDFMMKLDGRLLMVEDHTKTAQQKAVSSETTVASAIKNLCQEHKHLELTLLEKFNDLRTHVTAQLSLKVDRLEQERLTDRIEQGMLKISGFESYYEKWCEINQKMESYEDVSRKDQRDRDMLHSKLGSIDRSIYDLMAKINEKVARPELQEVVSSRLDWNTGALRNIAREVCEETLRKDRVDHEHLIARHCGSAISELSGKIAELKLKLNDTSSRAELQEQSRKWSEALERNSQEQWHSLNNCRQEHSIRVDTVFAELRSKIEDELRLKLDEIGKHIEIQSCKDLNDQMATLRQNVSTMEDKFKDVGRNIGEKIKDLGDHWSQRDRDITSLEKAWTNLEREWSKREEDWARREEELNVLEQQWAKRLWGYRGSGMHRQASHPGHENRVDEQTGSLYRTPRPRSARNWHY